jgi:hypothetical protein
VVGEAAVSAGPTDTFLGERYRRIARPHWLERLTEEQIGRVPLHRILR